MVSRQTDRQSDLSQQTGGWLSRGGSRPAAKTPSVVGSATSETGAAKKAQTPKLPQLVIKETPAAWRNGESVRRRGAGGAVAEGQGTE